MPAHLVVPVWMDEWQYACCGAEFAVGDRVSWTLGESDLLGPHLSDWTITIPVLHTVGGDDGQVVVVAGIGDLVVHLPGADASAPRTVGVLAAESHGKVGPGDPPTRGRVQAIQVVSWRHEVPGSATLTDVPSSDRGDLDCQGLLVTLHVAG